MPYSKDWFDRMGIEYKESAISGPYYKLQDGIMGESDVGVLAGNLPQAEPGPPSVQIVLCHRPDAEI